MLVALLLLLVFTQDHCSIHILQHQLTSCGSYQHGIHQQPWSHVQQYENGDNETLVLHGNRSCHILTLLNISNIYNNFIINITFFMFLFLWYLMALLVLLVMTMRPIMLLILNMSMVTMTRISCTRHKSNRQEGN